LHKKKKSLSVLLSMMIPIIVLLFSNTFSTQASTIFSPPSGDSKATGSEYWDFDNDTVVSWIYSEDFNGAKSSKPLYFNISDIFYNNNTGYDSDYYYYVQLRELYFNATFNKVMVNSEADIINASLVNFTTFTVVPMVTGESWGYFNLFIPNNGTSGLHLRFFAEALLYYYGSSDLAMLWTSPTWQIIGGDTLFFYDSTMNSNSYVRLVYYSNGTLKTGEIFEDFSLFMPGYYVRRNLTRNFDFNPIDDIEWDVEKGDLLYYGLNLNETKYEIVGIVNITEYYETYQYVLANRSIWNFEFEIWQQIEENITIGQANEYSFNPNVVIPISKSAEDIYNLMLPTAQFFPAIKLYYGDNWFSYTNTSSGDKTYWEYFSNGITKYNYFYNGTTKIYYVTYWKNITECIIGYNLINYSFWNVNYNFNLTVEISINNNIQYLYAAFSKNPTGVKINKDEYFYFDLMFNEISQIKFPINITIEYDTSLTDGFILWYFNETLKTWIQIPFTDNGAGTITVKLTHNSIYALTSTKLTTSEEGEEEEEDKGEDKDDGESNLEIPLGNYYLVFIAMGILVLVISKKRKL